MLQELMFVDACGAERDQIIEIATLLLPWCRGSNYGCLFDGVSNLSLTGKIAHFELGYVPDSAKDLKSAAGFLITNDARKHIITLPRAFPRRRNRTIPTCCRRPGAVATRTRSSSAGET
jgi:hypothetical protein